MSTTHTRALWAQTLGVRRRYAAAIAALAAAQLLYFGHPLVVQATIDGVLTEPGGGWLPRWTEALLGTRDRGASLALAGGLVVALATVAGCLLYLKGRWTALAAEALVRRLRATLMRRIVEARCASLDEADTGDLVQRCTSDVDTVRVFLSTQVVEVGRAALTILIVTPILFALDATMACASLVLLPVIVGFAWAFFRRVREVFRAADEAEGALTTRLQENLTGIRVVRAFARQDHERALFGERNARHRERLYKLIRLLGNYWAVSDLLCFTQIALVLFLGAHLVSTGALRVGEWIAFTTYMSMVIWPLRQFGRVLADAGKATVSLERLGEILDAPLENAREAEARAAAALEGVQLAAPADAPRGALDVANLVFGFAEKDPVLRGLTLSVAAGETVALIGPPGAGKSTLVQLLLRLYDYEQGSIHIDGRPLTSLPRSWVRRHVGAVLQDPFLYSKTVADNLRVGRSDAGDADLERAARAACVHDAIAGFEHGYGTAVGERGVTLSGGQRQRTALARALLADPAVLVLDDALSAVDSTTEARVLAALEERRGRRTTLLIAHRLSTVRHADRVFVLDGGRVVQHGTHAELAAIDGPYRRLCELQTSFEDELDTDLRHAALAAEDS